ncbi:hypothetical protein CL1_0831 [Thermococcus cleftensis]|uniref:Delta-aminolevulinic acid dehydratase n=1 Tax=Thermococcus cleftensis (strain DSM 27260 / KACC 17922 / CL1) TaxID=163003 RepID=I3ZTK2_THECF|nr:hypothetical protein [Thermococcus cleftensis]AFL95036.1 hypothetical protein CL1_0831 [Thermococcus cleftensis]
METLIWNSLLSLYSWVKKERYRGWDPYDWLSSPIAKKLKSKPVNFILLQANLYSPINLRPKLRIKKGISNKAVALFAQSYLTLSSITGRPEFKAEAKRALSLLDEYKIETSTGIGWPSHYFSFFGPKHLLTPEVPDIVGTCEAIKAFSMGYKEYKLKKYKRIASKAVNHILNEHLSQKGDVAYFKYTPHEEGKIVFNVSALTLESLSYYLRLVEYDEKLVKIGSRTIKFLLQYQTPNGAWPYSYYLDSKKFYFQLDYHQGFIIDGLLEFLPYIMDQHLARKTMDSILKATKFYMDVQFNHQGVSYYRYPIKYPIDVHNQAQGIITFSKLYNTFNEPKYLNFAERIAEWTIKNMQDPSGYFYSHKWPGFANKIPYMRWGQAWMMMALATLLKTYTNNQRGAIWKPG